MIEYHANIFKHRKLSKWELLAAMQALAVYILIRLSEGETDDNFDFLLLATMTVSLLGIKLVLMLTKRYIDHRPTNKSGASDL